MSLNSLRIQRYQPSKLNNRKKRPFLVVKRTFFSIVQLSRLVFLDPVGVQRHTVPHFKGLFLIGDDPHFGLQVINYPNFCPQGGIKWQQMQLQSVQSSFKASHLAVQ